MVLNNWTLFLQDGMMVLRLTAIFHNIVAKTTFQSQKCKHTQQSINQSINKKQIETFIKSYLVKEMYIQYIFFLVAQL